MKQRYIYLDWPESQPFIGRDDCRSVTGMGVFIPEELYNQTFIESVTPVTYYDNLDKMTFVDHLTATKLSKLGFEVPCLAYYTLSGKLKFNLSTEPDQPYTKLLKSNSKLGGDCVAAPSLDQVINWLLVRFDIHISIRPIQCDDTYIWGYEVRRIENNSVNLITSDPNNDSEVMAKLSAIKLVLKYHDEL